MSLKPVYPRMPLVEHLAPPVGPPEQAGATRPQPPDTAERSFQTELRVAGVREVHPEQFEKWQPFSLTAPAGLTAGAILLDHAELAFHAKSIIVDNLSNYTLYLPNPGSYVPPAQVGFVVKCVPAVTMLSVVVVAGAAGATPYIYLKPLEAVLGPSGGGAGGAGATTVTVDQVPHAAGSQGNLWNAAVLGAGANSAGQILANQHYAAVFGNVSAATIISLQYSIDNVNYYTVQTITTSGASDFGFTNLIVPISLYIRLSTSAAVTATATLVLSD